MKAHLLLACISISTLAAVSSWQMPHSSRRYNEVCYLTSHNSYAAKNHGFYYAQQTLTLQEQLALGVRGFLCSTRGSIVLKMSCSAMRENRLHGLSVWKSSKPFNSSP